MGFWGCWGGKYNVIIRRACHIHIVLKQITKEPCNQALEFLYGSLPLSLALSLYNKFIMLRYVCKQ